MREKTSISDIKKKAKEKLLGNYSLAIGSFVILFALIYLIYTIASGGAESLIFSEISGDQGISEEQIEAILSNGKNEIMISILFFVLMAVVTPLVTLLTTGYLFIIREISYEREARSSGIFHTFKNHPDKVIIIALISYAVQTILTLPAFIYDRCCGGAYNSGITFLIYMILTLAGAIVTVIYDIAVSQSYLLYLDNNELDAVSYIKTSISMMKGNKWRYFCMLLSFVGYGILLIASLGIASLWIVPYYEESKVLFYRDLTEKPEIDIEV